jgi:hypothetical protein
MVVRDGEIRVEWVPIGSVRENGWNPNVLPSRKFAHLRRELVRVGFASPILVSRDGTIINGEHRWRAAREEGFSEVPVVRIDVDEETARTISLNLNSIHGEADRARLALMLAGMEIDMPKDELLDALDMTDREMVMILDPSKGMGGGGSGTDLTCPRCGHRFVEGRGGTDGQGAAGGPVEDHVEDQGEGDGA